MTVDDFNALVERLIAAGVPAKDAGRWAAFIGDTPYVEGDEVIVRDETGCELGRVPVWMVEPETR